VIVPTDDLDGVIAFVGAGISAPAQLPTFDVLRAELFADVLGFMPLRKKTRGVLAERLARLAPEYCVSLLDEPTESGGRANSARTFICSRLTNATPTVEHYLLATAMSNGARVYTPNFDRLIETAAGESFEATVRRHADDEVGQAPLRKLHGSCPDILVSAEDVMLSIAGPWAEAFLDDCRTPKSHLLVWGYRGVDPDLAPLVVEGARCANRCTWIAFTDGDRNLAAGLIGDLSNVELVFAGGDLPMARRAASAVLDPSGQVGLADAATHATAAATAVFHPRSVATRARALAHLGGSRLGRRAWMRAGLSGDRGEALEHLLRSYLFDSRILQAVVLPFGPRLITNRDDAKVWQAVLTAAEGHGVRSSTDRLTDVLLKAMDESSNEAGQDPLIRARVATLLRGRGRLAEALSLLESIDHDERPEDRPDATWTGRLTYERSIVHRLRGEVEAAAERLRSIDTSNVAIVGANWSMWLQDEVCALAIQVGAIDRARESLERAHDLAMAYGDHRLAEIDLTIRGLQVSVLERSPIDELRRDAKRCTRRARRLGILTPVRRCWLAAVLAEAGRRSGDVKLATASYRRLARSPYLPDRLTARAGLLLVGQPHEQHDLDELARRIGPSAIGRLYAFLLDPSGQPDSSTGAWADELRAGEGLLSIS
jgi:hypothetical protein